MGVLNYIKEKCSYGFWNVGIIDCTAEEIVNGKTDYHVRWMQHKSKTKFYADPFPVGEDSDYYYILAEEFSYFTRKGIIVKLTINKETMDLVKNEVVLNTGVHLSFPFPFKDYIIPEQYRSGKLYAYKNGNARCICDDAIIDPCILEYNNNLYLFGTRIINDQSEANTHLYMYKYDGTKFILEKTEPIKCDIQSSRPAGKFFRIDNQLYRPVQDSERIYGGQTRIMRVEKVEDGYTETEVKIINTSQEKKFNEGMHTFNTWHDVIVVDGFQRELRLLYKPFFALNSRLNIVK